MPGHRIIVATLLLPLLLLALPALAEPAAADQQTEPREEEKIRDLGERGGTIRLGGFFVANIDTIVGVSPADVPIGARFSVSRDLGMENSVTVPRMMFAYRFSRRHRLDAGWYRIARSGRQDLQRDIEFNGRKFDIGTNVDSHLESDVYKAAYTWVFHDSEKVMLGLGPGIYVAKFDVGIAATNQQVPLDETEGLTAPLPVLGGRLTYSIGPKVEFLLTADLFMIDIGTVGGLLTDSMATVEYRPTKHFGFGGGLNILSMDVRFEDSETDADLSHTYRGLLAYASFHF
jgi:hypothetical protein